VNQQSSTPDPVAVDSFNAVGEVSTPRAFAASLVDKRDEELMELLHALEAKLAQPNAPGRVWRELDEVVWEIERRETARRTRERRQANVEGLRHRNRESMADDPGVWVHGRPLDDRERKDLAAFIRWVVATEAQRG
jgi:hypothetical protein